MVLQASQDAKKLVDEERAFARAEIENARAAVQRVEEALQEHERMSRALGKQVRLNSFVCIHVQEYFNMVMLLLLPIWFFVTVSYALWASKSKKLIAKFLYRPIDLWVHINSEL